MLDDRHPMPDKASLKPRIEIVIDAAGDINLQTLGTTGPACDLLSGVLESSLGEVVARTNKDTYMSQDSSGINEGCYEEKV